MHAAFHRCTATLTRCIRNWNERGSAVVAVMRCLQSRKIQVLRRLVHRELIQRQLTWNGIGRLGQLLRPLSYLINWPWKIRFVYASELQMRGGGKVGAWSFFWKAHAHFPIAVHWSNLQYLERLNRDFRIARDRDVDSVSNVSISRRSRDVF